MSGGGDECIGYGLSIIDSKIQVISKVSKVQRGGEECPMKWEDSGLFPNRRACP